MKYATILFLDQLLYENKSYLSKKTKISWKNLNESQLFQIYL